MLSGSMCGRGAGVLSCFPGGFQGAGSHLRGCRFLPLNSPLCRRKMDTSPVVFSHWSGFEDRKIEVLHRTYTDTDKRCINSKFQSSPEDIPPKRMEGESSSRRKT
jgi:hypothetical protein